ncbi:MAG: phosphoglycerate kinase [Rhodospirillales bacterium RIFCSPLOWO2_12_FULL_58_28]|nr:MAG: phosphoglycerate kinase [Rhodospirillales bacterium RIFCSPLOWO2_02_FULL_58_16]OHC79929.1 MAG: phosphoglycerate kinase [Rhodospirillales bacterium RIFCSPLOWO2_12_FULL_58_28]
MKKVKTIDTLDLSGKRVLVRADLNVPMRNGRITDSTRLMRMAPTVKELVAKGATVIVISHFGRPKGVAAEGFSLRPLVEALSGVVGRPVTFIEDCVGAKVEWALSIMPEGHVALLENLRFHPGEERNAAGFAGGLAALADCYVNDAFSCAHRAHASTSAIAHLLPAAAGRLMQAELEALGKALDDPQRPLAAIVGGAKVSTKMEVLGNLAAKVNLLIIGGAMANTFLHAEGIDVGNSLYEHDMVDSAHAIMTAAKATGAEIMLPRDAVVALEGAAGVEHQTVSVTAVPKNARILDIGPGTAAAVTMRLSRCRTLVWNGPFGAFETPPFDAGTNEVARAVARMTMKGDLISVAGGGDTVAALANTGAGSSFTYVSTAGGAFLEWLEGKELPGVSALYEDS